MDKSVNAAAITFDPSASGRKLRTLAIEDGVDTVATVTFDETGALVQIELLDAKHQLPRTMRGSKSD